MGKEAPIIFDKIKKTKIKWQKHFRIVSSKFPPINFFEDLVSPDLMDEVFFIESLTNDRLRDECGDINLVPKENRVSGKDSSVIMAAFTHPARSRFSDGTFGIYYAAKELKTAIYETIYHTEIFLNYTQESPGEHVKRVYVGKRILEPLLDIREDRYQALHHPNELGASRNFGWEVKNNKEWGILYNSVRHKGGECVAIFRPRAIELPVIQSVHLQYHWDGSKITHWVELGAMNLVEA